MLDPREDLIQDTIIWELVLTCATSYKDLQIFGNLHGLRCGGALLYLKDNDLSFKLPIDWSEEIKKQTKEKYIIPYITQFKELFSFVAIYYKKHKDELGNYSTGDIFVENIFNNFFQ